MKCASCPRDVIVTVVQIHEGVEWHLCVECWKPTLVAKQEEVKQPKKARKAK